MAGCDSHSVVRGCRLHATGLFRWHCHCVRRSDNGSRYHDDRLIDLTHPFDEQTIYWPTEDGFKLMPEAAGVTEQGYLLRRQPVHVRRTRRHAHRRAAAFLRERPDGRPVAARAAGWARRLRRRVAEVRGRSRLSGDASKISRRGSCSTARRSKTGSCLIRTGFGSHWPDREKYLGTAETRRAAVAKLHFPGLDPAAADWLVTQAAHSHGRHRHGQHRPRPDARLSDALSGCSATTCPRWKTSPISTSCRPTASRSRRCR